MQLPFAGKLSGREQRLAAAVSCLLLMWLFFVVAVRPIIAEWERLNGEIEVRARKVDLLKKILQMEQSVNVQYFRYGALLKQESSDEAVRNELMQDINTMSAQSWLKAPVIKQAPTELHDFYKRYFVDIDIEGVPPSIVRLLTTLQRSDKLFRVESLTITKKENTLSGRMRVSRILVPAEQGRKPPEVKPAIVPAQQRIPEPNLLNNGDMEVWTAGWGLNKYPDSWSGYRVSTVRVSDHVASGFAGAQVTGAENGSIFYQEVKADSGSRYQVTSHVTRVSGWLSLQVRDVAAEKYYEEAALSVEDQSMRAYTQTFTTMGDPSGEKRTLRVTLFFHLPGSTAYIDNVRMVKLERAKGGQQK
jgi:Tfp pilus assembly protein PilO